MADNLTIAIAADSSKLRADLAIAQAALKDFASEVRKAAAESLKTGNTAPVREAAASYEEAKKKVDGLSAALRQAHASAKDSTPWRQAAASLGEVRAATVAVGHEIGHVADNVIPHFKEVLALTVVGAVTGFVELVRSSAEAVHHIGLNAQELGLSVKQFQELGFAATQAGVDMEAFATGFGRLARSAEKAAEDQTKTAIELAQLVVGKSDQVGVAIANSGAKTTGKLVQVAVTNLAQIRDAATIAFNVLVKAGQAPAGGLEAWLFRVRNDLNAGGKTADDMRQKLAKLGADVPAKTIFEALERQLPGFTDAFTKFGVKLRDTNGIVKSSYVLFGDLAEKFSAMPDGIEKTAKAIEIFGRGGKALIPLLNEGREGLKKYAELWKELGVGVDEATEKQAEDVRRSFTTLATVIVAAKNVVGVALGSALIDPLNDLTTAIASNFGAIREWAQSIATEAKPALEDLGRLIKGEGIGSIKTDWVRDMVLALKGLGEVAKGLVFVFQSVAGAVNIVAQVINFAFGTHLTGGMLVALGVVGQLSGAFRLFGAGVKLVDIAISAFVTGPLARLVPVMFTIAGLITWPAALAIGIGVAVGAIIGLMGNFDGLGGKIGEIITALSEGNWGAAWKAAGDAATIAIEGVTGALKAMLDKIIEGAQGLAGLIGAQGGNLGPVGDTGGVAAASGGYIRGPGSGTSDSIRAWVSNGEFIVNAAATRANLPLLRAINSMRAPMRAPGFALGGLVDAFDDMISAPRFATGGLVAAPAGGGTPVHLHIGGSTYEVSASRSVAADLVREGRSQQAKRAGRAPGWQGG